MENMSLGQNNEMPDSAPDAYFYFIKTICVLSESPEKQISRIVDSFNFAWEIRDDFLSGIFFIRNDKSLGLSDREEASIQNLNDVVTNLPEEFFRRESTITSQVMVMKDPAWENVRDSAKQTLLDLSTKTQQVFKLLNLDVQDEPAAMPGIRITD